MFKLIKIQLEIFASLQTLFPPLKIDIFCRIAPLSFIKKVIKIQLENFATLENFWTPANAVSSFENWHFLSHRPPIFHRKTHQNWAWNFWAPANAVSSFENWHFLLHRPPYFSLRIWNESSWKNLYPLQTLILPLKIAIFWRIAPLLSPDVPH